jgi:intracellular sulfur oxidation DsrE/DsrF family protein
MKKNPRPLLLSYILLIGYLLLSLIACSTGNQASKELKSIKVVIDFRANNPEKAATYLTMIGDTLKDGEIQAIRANPDFVVIFGGQSVKLLAKDVSGFSPEEQKMIDEVKAKISALAKEGVKFEYCRYTSELFGVDPADLPGVRSIDNSWVALIDYEAKGYALIPAF